MIWLFNQAKRLLDHIRSTPPLQSLAATLHGRRGAKSLVTNVLISAPVIVVAMGQCSQPVATGTRLPTPIPIPTATPGAPAPTPATFAYTVAVRDATTDAALDGATVTIHSKGAPLQVESLRTDRDGQVEFSLTNRYRDFPFRLSVQKEGYQPHIGTYAPFLDGYLQREVSLEPVPQAGAPPVATPTLSTGCTGINRYIAGLSTEEVLLDSCNAEALVALLQSPDHLRDTRDFIGEVTGDIPSNNLVNALADQIGVTEIERQHSNGTGIAIRMAYQSVGFGEVAQALAEAQE